MGIPLIQQFYISCYILRQRLRRKRRYPLVLMLEPLFRCNLACAGCGKIDYPEEVLDRQLSVAECLSAVDECGAPIVSIAGGEPLLHEDMPQIVERIVRRKKFVYLCTNGLLLRKCIHAFSPSPYFSFSVHLDGNRNRHDALVCRTGVFDAAVEAIRLARRKGFRVTINCTLYKGVEAPEVARFFDFVTGLGVEGITVAPGFRQKPDESQEVFLDRSSSVKLFREIFKLGKGRKWNFNHTKLYLDFLAGNSNYPCTPWGNPTRNIFGWQKPCYLLGDEGHASSFEALMEETHWEAYGTGRNAKCVNCMLHSGFEATAVNEMFIHPFKALGLAIYGLIICGLNG